MTAHDFTVGGQRVLVVGAARSGVAAARLLARRGAHVTLTDRKPGIAMRASCAGPASRSSWAATCWARSSRRSWW